MPTSPASENAPADPVLLRRARIQRWVEIGSRVGYACLVVALVAFVAGAIAGLPDWSVTVTIAGLMGATATLPAAIVFGYAVKAAEREEREATK